MGKGNTKRANTKIYVANSNREVKNATVSGMKGEFQMSNIPDDPNAISNLNSSTNMSYNLDMSDVEITYSAFITYIDPDNTELTYTEYIDIIELRDLPPDTTGGSGGTGSDFANILFDFDKYFLRQKSKNVLESVYQFMKDNPTVTIRLEGHTDWFGSEPYNMGLSKNRSLSAHKYLINKGISPNRIQNAWFGETQPTANTQIMTVLIALMGDN